MFCPACANPNSVEQKFCRSCGMNLESAAASLLEQYPDGSHAEMKRQERALERFGKVAFTGFAVALFLGVIAICYTIINKMILSDTQPLAGGLFLAFVIFSALGLAYVIWNESLKEKRAKLNQPRELPPPIPNLELPAPDTNDLIPVPSVVEDTTKLLKVDVNKRAE